MNKQRRENLQKAIEHLDNSMSTDEMDVFKDEVNEAKYITEEAMEEEQAYIENLPENLSYSMKADAAQENVDDLGAAIESMEEAIEEADDANGVDELSGHVNDAIDYIQSAIDR